MRICYHGVEMKARLVGNTMKCHRPPRMHIKAHGDSRIVCDSAKRAAGRAVAPFFVSSLAGANCRRCRERYARRLRNAN